MGAMRYVAAMIAAVVAALLTTLFVSPRVAGAAVALFTFDSPDEVGNLEDGVYMLTNLAGLMLGWAIGWYAGGRFVRPAGAG
jgi:hypothetical protein